MVERFLYETWLRDLYSDVTKALRCFRSLATRHSVQEIVSINHKEIINASDYRPFFSHNLLATGGSYLQRASNV